jgi:hypothetical protein
VAASNPFEEARSSATAISPPARSDADSLELPTATRAPALAARPRWKAEGDQDRASFGQSVATAGDVNGDGYDDVIVGAPNYDAEVNGEGRALVYYGSAAGLSATPDWSAGGDQDLEFFGFAVGTAGDVNGDGYADVIVGAYFKSNGQTREGRAFVYYGSPSGLSIAADWTAESDQASANFGISVSTAGDVNGDGYDDVIVGAYHFDHGNDNEGAAFVYYGSASGLSQTPDWVAEGNKDSAEFGNSVSTAGDVNGDGYDDVIVVAPRYQDYYEGRAFVYLGSATGLSLMPGWKADNTNSAGTAGDVNGDGYDDVIVGDFMIKNQAFVYHGSSSGPSLTPDWTFGVDDRLAYFGYAVGTTGDVDGDGYDDVVIGEPMYDHGNPFDGRAYFFRGSVSGLSTMPDGTAQSVTPGAAFGTSVGAAGDVNGDGYADAIIGAPMYSHDQVAEGGALVLYGRATPPTSR